MNEYGERFAQALAELKKHGLMPRVSSLTVGASGVSVELDIPEARARSKAEDAAARAAEHEDLMYGSAG